MDTGATVPVSATPISAVVGNLLVAQTDGLYVGNHSGLILYVDSVNGVDTNPGSKAAPIKTITQCVIILNSLVPGGVYGGTGITVALKCGQNYPWPVDLTTARGSDLRIAFYGDPQYGDFNSPVVGTGASPGMMSDLQRPVIQPQASNVAGQAKLAGINRQGGTITLLGVTVSLPAAPATPSILLYGGFVDFIRNVSGANDGGVNTTGTIVNMTDITAFWGFMGCHSRSFTQYNQYASQFQINGILMTAANNPSTGQLNQRQYFLKFFPDFAGNNQQSLVASGNSLNSSSGSGMMQVSWSDVESLTVATGKTNQQSYPLAFDTSFGLRQYIFNLSTTANGQPLNFLSTRLI